MTLQISDATSLQFALRWGTLSAPLQVALIVALVLLPLLLVVWLFRYEMQMISRTSSTFLLVLRVAVLLLVWGLVCFQPSFQREETRTVSGKVLVIVDDSYSSYVPDPHRSDAQKLQLVRALNLARDYDAAIVNDDRLQEWIARHQADQPIEWVAASEHANNPDERAKLAQERRSAHDQLIARVEAMTRREIAQRILIDEGGVNLANRLRAANHSVEAFKFGRDVRPLSLDEIKKALEQSTQRGDATKKNKQWVIAPSRVEITDLNQPLETAKAWADAQEGKIVGVILLTDGRHVDSIDLKTEAILGDLKYRKVPLFPIALGADAKKQPPDAAILSFEMPPTAARNDTVTADVEFRVAGLKRRNVKLKLYEQGNDEAIDEREVIYVPDERGSAKKFKESFAVRLSTAGSRTYRVAVEPQGDDVKEIDLQNNKGSRVISVTKDFPSVLVIDGEARWEFHYLFNALLRDPQLRDTEGRTTVKGVVFIQPRLGSVPQSELDRMNYPARALPKLNDQKRVGDDGEKISVGDPLNQYDCIILGDVLPELLSMKDRARLEKYVANRGGTLVILAGKRGMPLRYLPDFNEEKDDAKDKTKEEENEAAKRRREWEEKDPLLRMLPIVGARRFRTDAGFHVTLTSVGKITPYLQMEPDSGSGENERRWASLHPHFWAVLGEAKEGATALAYVRAAEKGLTLKEIRERERKNALIVTQSYGNGEVLYVGLDSTWRWRYRAGDTYHHRFWGQTIRRAASDKSLATGNRELRFGALKPEYALEEQAKEDVEVQVRLEDAADDLTDKDLEQARARILRVVSRPGESDPDETEVRYAKLRRNVAKPRLLEIEPFKAGELGSGYYEIELDVPALDKMGRLDRKDAKEGESKKLRAGFTIKTKHEGELADLSPDHEQLERMVKENRPATADASHRVYHPNDVSELVKAIEERSTTKEQLAPVRLWLWWPTLVLIVLLLSTEWVVRKFCGLP